MSHRWAARVQLKDSYVDLSSALRIRIGVEPPVASLQWLWSPPSTMGPSRLLLVPTGVNDGKGTSQEVEPEWRQNTHETVTAVQQMKSTKHADPLCYTIHHRGHPSHSRLFHPTGLRGKAAIASSVW